MNKDYLNIPNISDFICDSYLSVNRVTGCLCIVIHFASDCMNMTCNKPWHYKRRVAVSIRYGISVDL